MGFLSKLLSPKNAIPGKARVHGIDILSDMNLVGTGRNQTATDAAAKAAADAKAEADAVAAELEKQRASEVQALKNIQLNTQRLSAANSASTAGFVANVVPGGTADLLYGDTRKKKSGTGIASSLGLNLGGS